MRRLDPRIRWNDLIMRMERQNRRNRNAINQQAIRARAKHNMLSWFPKGKPAENHAKRDELHRTLTAAQTATITMRGSTSASLAISISDSDEEIPYPMQTQIVETTSQDTRRRSQRVPIDPDKAMQPDKRRLAVELEETHDDLGRGLYNRSAKRRANPPGPESNHSFLPVNVQEGRTTANLRTDFNTDIETKDPPLLYMEQQTPVLNWDPNRSVRTQERPPPFIRQPAPTANLGFDRMFDMDEADALLDWAYRAGGFL